MSELTYLQKLKKDYLRLEKENEELRAANDNLLKEIVTLENALEGKA